MSRRSPARRPHPIDVAAGLVFRSGLPSTRVFVDGWGDARRLALITDPPPSAPPPIEIRWQARRKVDHVLVRDGTYASPAPCLPAASRLGRVRLVGPRSPSRRLAVVMAAWNDHGYRTRTDLARQLAARGVTSVLPENPYYGSRRPWPGQPIRTVADFAAMGRAAVVEGLGLIETFSEAHDVAVAGYSMGANISALIGAATTRRVAVAPLAASPSPAPVWFEGSIRHTIDWAALGGRDHAPRLRAVLDGGSALRLPPTANTAAAVIVGATRDGYIPAAATRSLHRHWAGSELRWVEGGHATLLWRRRPALVKAILDAFDRRFG